MKTLNEYEQRELAAFRAQKHAYFDSAKDFAERLDSMDIPEQIRWIANGTYGLGACLALRLAVEGLSPRCNAVARVGQVILHAFCGKPFTGRDWHKLPPGVQSRVNTACEAFLSSEKEFAA